MDDGFTRFTNVMQEDLDRRQIGGGNLSMEIFQERILQPIQEIWIPCKHLSRPEWKEQIILRDEVSIKLAEA